MTDTEKTPWWAHAVALGFIVVGGLVEWHTVSTFLETQSVQNWPKVEGKIVSSEVSWKTLRPTPEIVYEYEMNGKPYCSTKIRPRGYGKGEADGLVQRPRPVTSKPTSTSSATSSSSAR